MSPVALTLSDVFRFLPFDLGDPNPDDIEAELKEQQLRHEFCKLLEFWEEDYGLAYGAILKLSAARELRQQEYHDGNWDYGKEGGEDGVEGFGTGGENDRRVSQEGWLFSRPVEDEEVGANCGV